LFQIENDISSITVWIVDELTGNLEKWRILEGIKGEKKIETKVVEAKLNRALYWE
jgi:hypothetical protein